MNETLNPNDFSTNLEAANERVEEANERLEAATEEANERLEAVNEEANEQVEAANERLEAAIEEANEQVEAANEINSGESRIVVNGEEITNSTTNTSNTDAIISISDTNASQNISIAYENEDGAEIFSTDKTQAELNIFDPEFYTDNNLDVATAIEGKYQGPGLNIQLTEALLPELAPTGSISVLGTFSTTIVDGEGNVSTNNITEFVSQYTAAIEHYTENGAKEGRDPSPLFDNSYYLEQNPDVASTLAGGAFEGDPLLHYVSAGANEGRDPNAFFDTSYYLGQNPDVSDSGFNPLEHYVLFGSSERRDPSPNFDVDAYLNQNPDVAAAGIDPLTDFLTTEPI